jgi:hypothetical protein
MTRTVAAYIAGLVDGEGSVLLFVNRSPSRTNGAAMARLKIAMCDEPVIQWLKDNTSRGTMTSWQPKNQKWKRIFIIIWNGSAAADLIAEIRPFLQIKGPHADVLLEWVSISREWQHKLGGSGRHDRKYPDSVWDQAEALAVKLRLMTHRGTPVETH